MINTIKTILNKISDLESKINDIKDASISNSLKLKSITNNSLNSQIINKKTIHLSSLKNTINKQMFFEVKICIVNSYQQNIKFSLLADSIEIGSLSQLFTMGKHEIIISGTYKNIANSNTILTLNINPISSKLLTIQSYVLNILGLEENVTNNEYHALETNTNFYFSLISNERLYYKTFAKNCSSIDYDFIFIDNAKSHSTCYDSSNDIIYIFRVDASGNLFLSNSSTHIETFIASNIDKISSCFSNNKIQFSYIKNNNCYFGEIKNYSVISNNLITNPKCNLIDCYLYFNSQDSKCYLLLTSTTGENYILKSIGDNFASSENICANINFTITAGV